MRMTFDFCYIYRGCHFSNRDFDNDALLVMLPTYLGLSAAAGIYDVKRMRFDSGLPEENVIADVHEFQLEGSFMFATKRSVCSLNTC